METDRQEELGSPMLEDFLDCDQLVSDSDGDNSISASPRRTLKRLHIHIDMNSTQYLTPGVHRHSEQNHIDGLPICTSGPLTGAYSSVADLDAYSAVSGVSSFNYPAAADPTLLTPASSSGSPPLSHKQTTKPTRSFHHSQTPALASQAPTPPDTSRMYSYNGYELNSGSQSPSPMTVNPSVTEAGPFNMPYMAHSPPVSHNPSSPRSDLIPPQIDPYLGHFTVSGGNDNEVTHHSLHEYHPYEVAPAGPYLNQQHVHMGTPHMHHRMPSDGSAPVLSQPNPSHFRPHPAPQPGAIEDLRDPSMFLGPYPPHGAVSPGRRPPQRKKPSSRKPSRAPRAAAQMGSDPNGQPKQEEDDEEELTLREDAPEDDKYLFQLRKQYLSEKGKGMWEEMKAKYSEKHQGNWEKAALQMKVSRAVARYGVWPQREIDRLRAAYEHAEKMRWQIMLTHMKENGGCRVWDWKRAHLETMLVKLGYEEPAINEKSGVRRRRQQKAAARRQGSPQSTPQPLMGDWSNGLGLPHAAYHGHAHHVAAGAAARQYNGMPTDDSPMPPNMTPNQEEDLMEQVFKQERSITPDDDGMDGLSYDSGVAGSRRPSTVAGQGLNHPGRARLARQACDQLLQQPS